MTGQHIANLRQLAGWLDDNADKLEHFRQFDMLHFRQGSEPYRSRVNDNGVIDSLTLGACGTAACAAGWAATLPGLQLCAEDFALGGRMLNWIRYTHRVFGLTPCCAGFCEDGGDSCDYHACFGAMADRPHDPRAAAERIRAVVDRREALLA